MVLCCALRVRPLLYTARLIDLGPNLWSSTTAKAHILGVGAQALLACWSGRRILDFSLDGTPPLPRGLIPAMGGLAAYTAASGAMIEKPTDMPPLLAAIPLIVPLLMMGMSLSLMVSARTNYGIAAGITVLASLHQGIHDIELYSTEYHVWMTRLIISTIQVGVICFGLAASYHWTMSVLRGVDTQSKVDAMRADLAAAEERLRIARDLHDVFGRTLTAVAVKSELAAALADAEGAQRAAEESRRIRDLADDALKEVRSVLAEYRRPDLATELAGAHSLLNAAGITVRIVGADTLDTLPTSESQHLNEAFALVVRESGTNIVRHSEATHATYRLDTQDGEVLLTVTNDGATLPTTPSDTPSSGLESLAARLANVGGTLHWQHKGHTFTVTAHMPTQATPEPDTTESDTPEPDTPATTTTTTGGTP